MRVIGVGDGGGGWDRSITKHSEGKRASKQGKGEAAQGESRGQRPTTVSNMQQARQAPERGETASTRGGGGVRQRGSERERKKAARCVRGQEATRTAKSDFDDPEYTARKCLRSTQFDTYAMRSSKDDSVSTLERAGFLISVVTSSALSR